MTWRPSKYLLEGELDNSKPGRVTGWLRFAGLKETVAVDLEGDFDRDIRDQKLRLTGRYFGKLLEAEDEMEGSDSARSAQPGTLPRVWSRRPTRRIHILNGRVKPTAEWC